MGVLMENSWQYRPSQFVRHEVAAFLHLLKDRHIPKKRCSSRDLWSTPAKRGTLLEDFRAHRQFSRAHACTMGLSLRWTFCVFQDLVVCLLVLIQPPALMLLWCLARL